MTRDRLRELEVAFNKSREIGQQLRELIVNCCSGDIRDFYSYLLMEEDEFDSFVLHEAIHGWWTDATAIVELMCSRNFAQLRKCRSVEWVFDLNKIELMTIVFTIYGWICPLIY